MAGIKWQGLCSHSRDVVGTRLATQPRTGVIEHLEEADSMTTVTESTAPPSPAGDEDVPLLRLRGVSKHFGPVQALTEVDLDIPAGQVTALAGDNGAGKSVMIKTISGIHPPDSGQMWWAGKPMHVHTPGEAAALGIETVYQDLALCDNLDIVQNMFLGRERMHRGQGTCSEIGRAHV